METLLERWNKLKEQTPGLRIRNAAEMLGVSELELLLCREEGVVLLQSKPREILLEVEPLGRVMGLTRNDAVVHERKGVYLNPELNDAHVGLFVGEDIDMRYFFKHWKYVLTVEEGQGKQVRKSLQFFATDGSAIHKIYLTPQSDEHHFNALTEKFRASEGETVTVSPIDFKDNYQTLDAEGVKAFQQDWLNMTDPHQFFGILMRYKLSRTDALRNAPEGGYATRLQNDVLKKLLGICADKEIPIMVFVGNRHAIQIHTGKVHSIVEVQGWLNVLDPEFNLHIKSSEIHEVWAVRKPTEGSVVTSVECYDASGNQIVQFFGKRKPGIPEREDWRDVVFALENADALVE